MMTLISKRWISTAAAWLERHGVDCSRDANEGDALAFLLALGVIAAFVLFFVSPWWSGFATAAIIFGAGQQIRALSSPRR